MRKTPLFAVLVVPVLLLASAIGWSAEWVWQADNHAGDLSYFTDGKAAFTMWTQGGWTWDWSDPAPGTVSLRGTLERKGRGIAFSSDFGEELSIDRGITIAARVKPVAAGSGGTLCLSVANSSTVDLPGGSTHIWVGWDVPNFVRIFSGVGSKIRRLESSVKYEGRWCVWTLSAKQIGDTVAWDVWIDGVHQGADQQAPDGSLHTLVGAVGQSDETVVKIGQRERIPYPHDTAWDYVAISNEGVIPGWTGNAAAVEEDAPSPRRNQPDFVAATAPHRARILVGNGHISEGFEVCEEALGILWGAEAEALKNYKDKIADLSIYKAMSLHELNRLPEAVQTCDEALALLNSLDPQTTDSEAIRELKFYKAEALLKQGRADEALEVCEDALSEYEATNPQEADRGSITRLKWAETWSLLQLGRRIEAMLACDDTLGEYQAANQGALSNPWYIRRLKIFKVETFLLEGQQEQAIGVIQSLGPGIEPGILTLWWLRKPAEARALFGALENEPNIDRNEIAFQLAYCSYVEQDWAAARDAFQALHDDASVPDNWRGAAMYMVGDCCERLEDYTGARRAFEEVLAAFPNAGEAKDVPRRLANLASNGGAK